MNLLLDTHTFLWFVSGSAELSVTARRMMTDPANHCVVSTANLWEIAIKHSLGKLTVNGGDFETVMDDVTDNQFRLMPITFRHLVEVNKLPHHHRDPFDRLLIAQAITENLTVLTRDPQFHLYPVPIIW